MGAALVEATESLKEEITIWSEGTRLAADLFIPESSSDDGGFPAILLCHGWAGPKAHLSTTYAPFFCEAGFACLTFDYRGWYESDARLATPDAQPSPDADGSITVSAYPVREVVDPLDQNRDIHNVLDYLLDHPQINPKRVGLWGSSFGGGHVIFVAGTDPRIRAVVSQVPGMGAPTDDDGHPTVPSEGHALGAAMAKANCGRCLDLLKRRSHSRVPATSAPCGVTFLGAPPVPLAYLHSSSIKKTKNTEVARTRGWQPTRLCRQPRPRVITSSREAITISTKKTIARPQRWRATGSLNIFDLGP